MTRIGIEAILFFMGTFLCGGSKYCDFTVNHPDGKSVGVEVKHFPILKGHIKLRLRDTIKRLKRIIDEGKYTKIRLVLVAGNANVLRRLNDYINELDAPNISFTIGLLSYSGGFEALRSTLYDEPLRFHTCFISFTEADDAFSERLYNDLQANGVRCWRWKEGAQWDKTLMHSIDEAVRVYDKLIVVCSEQSLNSPPVIREIERALQKEDDLS